MLPARHRLRASDEFRAVVRGGVRVGNRSLVVHARPRPGLPSRAGFVVSRAVGGAVTRNRVRRRLRHLVAGVLPSSPVTLDVVVRALPPAASGPLAADFAAAWRATLAKLGTAS